MMMIDLLDNIIPATLDIYTILFRSGAFEQYLQTIFRIWTFFLRWNRKNYDKLPLVFLSDYFYWKDNNHPFAKLLENSLVNFNDYFVENIHRTYFENIRNHLISNGLLPRIHGNIKRMPQWKTNMVIDKNVAEIVKNFLENYAEVHGLPSPGRSINRVTQSIVFLPAEMSYKSVHRDFLAGLA